MKLPRRGVLLAIEGIDGAGKTTLVAFLERVLSGFGLEVVRTKEPTERTEAGRLIRSSAATHRLPLVDELHAFVEDRRAHVETLIGPALADGKVVLVDRYYFSTIAYQGARGADITRVRRMNEEFAPVPDVLFVLDIPASAGLARVRSRGEVSAFEKEEELEAAGRIFATMQGPHVVHVDAQRSADEVAQLALRAVVEGPLHERFCSDGQSPPCDLAWCVRRDDCAWPGMLAGLAPEALPSLREAMLRPGLSDDDRIAALVAAIRAEA